MQVEREFRVSSTGVLIDADLSSTGDVLALMRLSHGFQLLGGGWDCNLDSLLHLSLVRAVHDDHILLVGRRSQSGAKNAMVVSRDGSVLISFPVGDGVQDVIVVGHRIVVSYFDEGVYSGDSLSGEGLFVFCDDGSPEFGYGTQFGVEAVPIDDCYAVVAETPRVVWFFPYTDFPLVRLDLETRSQEVFRVPERLHGAQGVAVTEGAVLFHGPYSEKTVVLAWDRRGGAVREVGRWQGRLRGTRGGRFLGVRENEVVILTPKRKDA